ncbi:MAG TPA: 16S rRNA (guanine(527)-N(7))-methyltransferase RsmG [Candidatus Sulfomarinibacteraceae bacterium]|nr:16S rRNA (guanine(527)-N(7))-methyltransferase RsmG [Candidatus Sulfomarinibacteraceae bacterium]
MTTPGVALSGGGASPDREARLNRQREPLPTRVGSLPDLPDSYARELDRALTALGLTLDATARAAIDGHVRLLLAWTAVINLTAITDPVAVARQHVADSLAAIELLRAGPHASVLDLGSGGGYPGLPIAAALPAARVLLLDSIAKKTAFLEVARRAVGLEDRLTVATARLEALTGAGPAAGWDVVTARAVGRLGDLVELALPVLRIGGRLVAWKRGNLADELAAGGRAAARLGGSRPEVHDVPHAVGLDGHVLVVVRKERPSPAGYPRDPAARRRGPW